MLTYEIVPLKFAIFHNHELSTLTYLTDIGEKVLAPVVCYLIKGNGRAVLVDTGCGEPDWAEKYHRRTTQTEDMLLLNSIRAAGVDPKDLDCIVNTHLHWDHCWCNNLFPDKKVYVQKKELQYAACPLPVHYVYYESAELGLIPPWTKSIKQYVAVDGDYELFDGIQLVFIPGHTPGFQGVLVNTTGGRYLIASDALGSYDNWYGKGHMKHIPPAIHVDLNECYRSFEKMEKICDYILPGHDMRVFDHAVYPYE